MSNLQEMKEEYKTQMDSYDIECREHIAEYGPKPCDYLQYRQLMESYYRGAYHAILEVEKLQ